MRIIWLLCVLLGLTTPIFSFAEIIPIPLPEFYTGYQPVGLINTSEGYLLAGNVKNPGTGWDISLLWLSHEYSATQHKLLSGNGSDLVSKILRLHENFFLLTNTSSDVGDLTKEHGIVDIGISKFDQSGRTVWARTLGGKGINQARDFSICDDGKTLAVVGEVNAEGGNISKIYGGWDIVVAHYDLSGALNWVTTSGSVNDDIMGSVLCDQGHVYVAYSSWVQDRNWDLKFVILNLKGEILREQTYGGSGSEIVHDLIKTPDGNFLILGSTDSVDPEMGDSRGKIDLWLNKIDPEGNLLWTARVGGSQNDLGHAMTIGADGSYWILGVTESRDQDLTQHIGGWDVCIFKINDKGDLLSSETYGTLDDDQPVQILPINNHIFFLSGTKRSDVFSEPFLIKKNP